LLLTHVHLPWPLHVVPVGHSTHCTPPAPHHSFVFPCSQKLGLPGPSRQQPGQLAASHWHLPWSQWPWNTSQVTQTEPLAPQAPSLVPGRH
jgi:hypothetical protein